jgi:radical SAM protein with 4Fe4S-binding SPASM domain
MTGTLEFQVGDAPAHRPVVYWYPSMRCNLACRHCWVNSSPSVDTSGDLTTEDALKVVGQLAELGAGDVIFSGGEALFRPDILVILEALLQARINTGFETNGLTFSERFVELVKFGGQQGVQVGITISLDGGTGQAHDFLRGPGTFERTLGGIRFLAQRAIGFDVQCVVNRTNVESIPAFLEATDVFRPQLGYVVFAFLHPVGRGEKLARTFGMTAADYARAYALIATGLEGRSKIVVKVPPALVPPRYMSSLFGGTSPARCVTSCAFPTLGVLSNGDVTICALTRSDPEVLYGNVRTDTLLEVWRRARMGILRQRYLASELGGICGDCRFKDSCKGACRAFAYDHSGDFEAPHPLCAELAERGEFPAVYRLSHVAGARRHLTLAPETAAGTATLHAAGTGVAPPVHGPAPKISPDH